MNGNILLCESVFGWLFEVIKDKYVCWEYINLYFVLYFDVVIVKIFLGELNVLFRVYRYSLEEILWLKKRLGFIKGKSEEVDDKGLLWGGCR